MLLPMSYDLAKRPHYRMNTIYQQRSYASTLLRRMALYHAIVYRLMILRWYAMTEDAMQWLLEQELARLNEGE